MIKKIAILSCLCVVGVAVSSSFTKAVSTEARRDTVGVDGFTPLMDAVVQGKQDRVRALLAAKANPNAAVTRANGRTIEINHITVIPNEGTTPLMLASMEGTPEIIGMLLAAGAKPDVRDIYGNFPLMYATLCGHVGVIQGLLAGGADPNATHHGVTPLQNAIKNGHMAAAQELERLMSGHRS